MSSANLIRQHVWTRLQDVALPDSRFGMDFSNVIPDFVGSARATEWILELELTKNAKYVFVTPDNGLVELRRRLLMAGCSIIVSTYGIHRGFVLLQPGMVPAGQELFAAWLDGLEHFGRPVSLQEIAEMGRFDYLVTGASAVSRDGVRFGKGHGYFDMEWGMFTELGIVDEATPVIAAVHDVQVVEDQLTPGPTDIIVDMIATPSGIIQANRSRSRPRGIRWDMLSKEAIAATPPLQELQRLQAAGMAGL